MTAVELTVTENHVGTRLDRYLAGELAQVSRAQLKKHIDHGCCQVNGIVARPAHRLHAGDLVSYDPPPPQPATLDPEDLDLDVLFEDDDLIVVVKPAGMVVHPAPGHHTGTLVAGLLHHCDQLSGVGGTLRPGIVHRLDRLTSGVMVASKTDHAHWGLAAQFHEHSIERRYTAVAVGRIAPESGTFETLHGRHPKDRKRFSSKVAVGRRAVTHYQVLEALEAASVVEARLETGRTHQVRVHFADHGHPLLGDPVYGGRPKMPRVRDIGRALARQALHARVLAFVHPRSGERLHFERQPPRDMLDAIEALRRT